jgi:PAS domain S-box-containing protein
MEPAAWARARERENGRAAGPNEELEALHRNEERLTLALAAGVVGTWDWLVQENKVFANERFARTYGVNPDEALRGAPVETFVKAIHPDDRERVRLRIEEAVAKGGDFSEEYRLVQADGSIRWVLARGRCYHDENGRATRFPGATTDITERKQAEQRATLLSEEINHRVSNLLTVVQAIVARTLDESQSITVVREILLQRVAALGRAQAAITSRVGWRIDLRELVTIAVAPHADGERFAITGDPFMLASDQALGLSLALHELVTNAVKYGALSVPWGRVTIDWRTLPGERLVLQWREEAGPEVSPPLKRGFGIEMIERVVAGELGAVATTTYAPQGISWTFEMPVFARTEVLS